MTTSGPLLRALAEALRIADVSPRDVAGVALARRYAQLIDAARGSEDEVAVAGDLGPKLLAALTALGLTLAGRGRGAKGGAPDAPASKLDELKQRREQRRAGQHGA